MKKTYLLIILSIIALSFILITGSLADSQVREKEIALSNWTEAMYNQYNYSSFLSYSPANSYMNFNDVDYDLLEAAIFYATSAERVKEGLPPFGYSYYLRLSAHLHAYDMASQNFFSHDNPNDVSKKTPFDRMNLYYVTGGKRAENIAYLPGLAFGPGEQFYMADDGITFMSGTTEKPIAPHTYNSLAKAVLTDWMNSPGHRANILDPELLYLGCGAVLYTDPSCNNMPNFKCVQNFGSIVPQNPY